MGRTLMVVALVAACTGSSNYWVAYSPVRGKTSQARPSAVQKAVIAVTDAGREVESSDAATGIVLTKWFSGDGFGGDQNRFRVRVTFDEASGYEIVSLCQAKSAATSAWSDDCDGSKRPRFVIDTITAVQAALQ